MMDREEWNKLTDDEKWSAYEELLNEKNEEVFTPHSFLKWEIDAAIEDGQRKREEAAKKTRQFWEQYNREHPNIIKE